MKSEICAVIVTFNRKKLLTRNIKSLLSQTIPLDILIFDNASTDGTLEHLKDENILQRNNVIYKRATKNLGGAGGFYNGTKEAYDQGYKFICLMDDDGYCYKENTIEQLLLAYKKINTPMVMLNSVVICNEDYELTFGLPGGIETYEQLMAQSKNGLAEYKMNPFNGTFFPREVVDRIGFPKHDFFIYGDEAEYMERADKHHISRYTVSDSIYFHPVNKPVIYKRLLGIQLRTTDVPVWKKYCETRNYIYIKKVYYSPIDVLKYIITSLLCSFYSKEKKGRHLKYTAIAIWDGLKNNFDREIMFDI